MVANEVKELAKETAKATEDISRKIAAIQGDTTGAVQAIGQISALITQIDDVSTTIASAVEEQTATTNEIGRNISEAARGSAEIAQQHRRGRRGRRRHDQGRGRHPGGGPVAGDHGRPAPTAGGPVQSVERRVSRGGLKPAPYDTRRAGA